MAKANQKICIKSEKEDLDTMDIGSSNAEYTHESAPSDTNPYEAEVCIDQEDFNENTKDDLNESVIKTEHDPDNNEKNPWDVFSLTFFLQYKCPECDFFCQEESDFADHAFENHEQFRNISGFNPDIIHEESENNYNDQDLSEISDYPPAFCPDFSDLSNYAQTFANSVIPKISSPRTRLSFKEKALILEETSKPNFDKEKICKDFGITKSCYYKILKDRESILAMNESDCVAAFKNFKKIGKGRKDELEIQLCQWILKSENENGKNVSGSDIKAKAKALSDKLGYAQNIKFSNGWLYRFKKRYDLKCKKLIGWK